MVFNNLVRRKKNISNKVEEKDDKKIKKKSLMSYIFKIFIFLFFVVLAYIIFFFVRVFNKNEVKIYEVTTGEIVNVDRHRGFIYRDESIAKSANDGYINFL